MALKKTTETAYGFIADNAYHRVESVSLTSKTKMAFALKSYASVDKPLFAEQIMVCDYDLEGSNPIKQAYEHLKTLSEFAGAVDC